MYRAIDKRNRRGGFTLIEIIITIALLLTITMAVSLLMRNSLDMKFALSSDADATHRLSAAMTRLARDVESAYLVSIKDEPRGGASRRWRGLFQLEPGNDTDKVRLTTMNHRPMKANARESDTSLVVYEVRDDAETAGVKHLYRGETPFVPAQDDLKDDPPMKIFIRHVKSIRAKAWQGDDWARDRWDSTRGDWRDKLPRMVWLEVEIYAEPPASTQSAIVDDAKRETVIAKTVVSLPFALEFKEIKEPAKTMKIW